MMRDNGLIISYTVKRCLAHTQSLKKKFTMPLERDLKWCGSNEGPALFSVSGLSESFRGIPGSGLCQRRSHSQGTLFLLCVCPGFSFIAYFRHFLLDEHLVSFHLQTFLSSADCDHSLWHHTPQPRVHLSCMCVL